MAVIVLTSASGSPGVTTTAVGLALTWDRPVLLLEADPTGGSAILAGYFRGQASPPDSLIDLVLAHRDGDLGGAIPSVAMRIPDSGVSFIPGTRAHGQVRSVAALWEPLAAALAALDTMGQDVIVDAGRLGLAGAPDPLLRTADLALLVTRTDLVALAGARSWAQTLTPAFTAQGAADSFGILCVGEKRPYATRDVAKVLAAPVVATVAWDDPAAEVFARGAAPPGRFERSALVRSLRSAQDAITATVRANTAQLAPSTAGGPS